MPHPTPIAPGFYAGIDGRVFLGSTGEAGTAIELAINKWSADASCPMSDRTNAKSGGYQAGTRTVKSLNGQFSCVVPNDATGDPEFSEGNTYKATLITHDGRGYQGNVYIETISPSSETTGDLGFDVKFKSQGAYIGWSDEDLASLPPGVTGQGDSPTGTV